MLAIFRIFAPSNQTEKDESKGGYRADELRRRQGAKH
jgi:hypothetical protein